MKPVGEGEISYISSVYSVIFLTLHQNWKIFNPTLQKNEFGSSARTARRRMKGGEQMARPNGRRRACRISHCVSDIEGMDSSPTPKFCRWSIYVRYAEGSRGYIMSGILSWLRFGWRRHVETGESKI